MIKILFVAFCCLSWTLLAQVRISEFLASNTQAHPDIVDFGDYPDWIELENTSASSVSLKGWYLSDDPEKPYRWGFPETAVIPAHGYVMVWADGQNAAPGQSFPRGYWPWKNFTAEGYHANFSLSALGDSLALTRVEAILSTPLILAAFPPLAETVQPTRWKYLDDGSDAGMAWRLNDFHDGAWAEGLPQFGYGDGDETTVVASGPISSSHPITTYFRSSFVLPDPGQVMELELRLLVDDGAVVYLNGKEVVRQNLPVGDMDYKTPAVSAVSGSAENAFSVYRLSSAGLIAGTNLVAVEVHQSAANSSDVSFDLSLSGLIIQGATNVDQHTFGMQVSDISSGRNAVGNWVSFSNPTPGQPNIGPEVPDLRTHGGVVSVSPDSGLYAQPISVTLSAPSGTIRYTLDGSLPVLSSPVYAGPIQLTNTTPVRARVFEEGKPNGPVATRTFFIGEKQGNLPYVSVVSDPKLLFDDRVGIYYNQHEPLVSSASDAARGLHDVYKGKDAPGVLEFFGPGSSGHFRVNGGYRMGGENNWVHAQRAMNFALRGIYGDDQIAYDLFPGTGIPLHTSITLRDGGDAWGKEMLRDGLWSFLQRGHMRVGVSDYRSSVVFINGNYWGIHNLRSRWDDAWFFQHHHFNAGEIDHLIYGHLTSGAVTLGAEKGDTVGWLELLNFLQTHDLKDPSVLAFVESRIDFDSFIDFIAAESWGINTSWHHNREFWRPRVPGGRWQWLLPDMDQTFRSSQLGTSVLEDMLSQDELLVRLKASTEFRQRLAQRLAAHAAATFRPARVKSLLTAMASEVESEVPRHEQRWSSMGGMTRSGRAAALTDMEGFIDVRASDFLGEIQARLGLPGTAIEVDLKVNPPGSGIVRIQGVPVEPGIHKVFSQIPGQWSAEAAPGYRFVGWKDREASLSLTLTLNAATALIAEFASSEEIPIGGTLTENTTLVTGRTYALDADLVVPLGVRLEVPSGVTFRMPEGRNIRVHGILEVQGTSQAPVQFIGRDGARWGGISFENPEGLSLLRHVSIRGATRGADPVSYPSAVSGLNAELQVENLDIEQCDGPIFCRGGSIVLRNSRLHTPFTGDCINVKRGKALIEDCIFIGNNAPDTDAIDYDGVVGGVVRRCHIYRFQGPNCDGIDIGEACVDILLEDNRIYYNSDKGFSVGQGSTVLLKHNLVVGCTLGVGVKDAGSQVVVDQNTFVDCQIGVNVYEKNFGVGGGTAWITNTLFSRCSIQPVQVDSLSHLDVTYSLSDTQMLPGIANLLADPHFVDPSLLNFQLQPTSPALDAGDPQHPPDPDGSRCDIGAGYRYQASDYPYALSKSVVIDELLANSEGDSDWVELFNRSSTPVDISGWFLSDSAADLRKYRIPDGTILGAGGRAVFRENVHFGVASLDPGKATAFALSDVGETVYLSSASGNELTDYRTSEDFGASLPGESFGNYYKASTGTWNFVPLQTPTPGETNSLPKLGPVVISEIHFAPSNEPVAEFVELLNVSDAPVSLYDAVRGTSWKVTDGVTFEFPSDPPLILAPGERCVLVANAIIFQANFSVPAGTRVIPWTAGRLANEGEVLQLGRPAGLNDQGVRQYARVDRVGYEPTTPWPTGALNTGRSLQKRPGNVYGNDPAAWIVAKPTPGAPPPEPGYDEWSDAFPLPANERGKDADPDQDGRPNIMEYALGSNPTVPEVTRPLTLTLGEEAASLFFTVGLDHPGVEVRIEMTLGLSPMEWVVVESTVVNTVDGVQTRSVQVPTDTQGRFFRLVVQ